MPKRLTYEEVKDYIESFGYKLISTEYINNSTHLEAICPNGHHYKFTYANFASGYRCGECSNNTRKSIKFISDYVESQGEKLVYYYLPYINAKDSLLYIKCKKCGEIYETSWNKYQSGRRCYCNKGTKWDIDKIKEYASKYGYTVIDTEYSYKNKINFICPNGHHVPIDWHHFVSDGIRCNQCNASSGESEIIRILNKYKINFIFQYYLEGCKYKQPLFYDFYLPNYNTMIEFDGKQHFKFGCFGKRNPIEFLNSIHRDNIKTFFCELKNINLLRISYYDIKNIENILCQKLNIIKYE